MKGLPTCDYEGKKYDELDVFDNGVNGCVKCICVDSQIYCNKTKCKDDTIKPTTKINTMIPTNHRSEAHLNEIFSTEDTKNEIDPGEILPPQQHGSEHPENIYIQRFKNGYRRRLKNSM